jgi:hypothetical protein
MSASKARSRLTLGQVVAMQEALGETAPEDVEELVLAYQTAKGLPPDGWPGLRTQRAIHLDGGPLPIPVGRKQLRRVYGMFDYSEGKRGRIDIDPKWVKENIVRVQLHSGKIIRFHKLISREFVEVFKMACDISGYTPTSVQTWVPRHTLWNASKPLSLHSWGIAVDFDPSENRMGGKASDGGPSLLRQYPMFVNVFKANGWTWGGDWRMKDDMHFQREYTS